MVISPASGMQNATGMCAYSCSQALAKAPKPKKAAWPMEICPVKPTRMFSPSAAMAEKPMVMSRPNS